MSHDPLRNSESSLYPVEIVQTRYGGTYEVGFWAAFPAGTYNRESDAFGNDVAAANWWLENRSLVGVGASPNDAVADLFMKATGGPVLSDHGIPPVDSTRLAKTVQELQRMAIEVL